MLGELAKLAQCWQAHNAPELAKATDDLFALFQRAFRDVAPEMPSSARTAASAPQATSRSVPDMSPHTAAAQPPVAATPIPQVIVDSHDDKAWRDTLLKVAAILCERQPESPLGYRLRRHALWQTITSTPQAESDGRTPLAAFPVDMMDDYLARLNNADMALWQQVEKSLLLAPYWLDGHYLSAQTALRLGYIQVADAIRDEVTSFLARLPALINLLFTTALRLCPNRRNSGWHHRAQATKPQQLYRPMKNYRQPGRASMRTGWKPRCGIWKTCPKVIPVTSFIANFSARSYWKKPVWFSLHNSSTGCSSKQAYT